MLGRVPTVEALGAAGSRGRAWQVRGGRAARLGWLRRCRKLETYCAKSILPLAESFGILEGISSCIRDGIPLRFGSIDVAG